MHEKVRFGIIGAGAIVRESHVPAIKKLAEAELVAICRRNKEKANRLAREWQVKEVYYDYQDLVKSKNINAVIIATPNLYHRQNTIAAAEEGKHVLCEKPMATNLKDTREMVKACTKNKVKLQIGFNQRFWNQVKIAKTLIDEGTIGEIKAFSTTYREKWDLYPSDTNYLDHFDLSGGGCLIDLGIHRIDMARFLAGEIKEVCAEIKHSVTPAKLDDNSWILCNFFNGATGCISSDKFSPAAPNETALYGTKGTIYLSTETFNPFQPVPLAIYTEKPAHEIPDIVLKYFYPTFLTDRPEKRWISIIPPKDDPYLAQLKAFCESIIEDKEPPVTGIDGVKSLEVVLASYKSAKERKWVKLPLEEEAVELPSFD